LEIIDRKIRETVDIKDAHKRVVILAKHLSKTEMQIKDTETHLKLLEHNADGTKIIVERLDPTYILRKGQNLILTKLLHAYPGFCFSLLRPPLGQDSSQASLLDVIFGSTGELPRTIPLSRRSIQPRGREPVERKPLKRLRRTRNRLRLCLSPTV